ncbi:MAG: Na/Pi cotransporter family protein [Nitrospirota bacterium]
MIPFFSLVSLVGGLVLLLYGLILSGRALEEAVGIRLRALLSLVTQNKILGVAFGAGLSAIIQSSSATTVILVRLTNAGVVSFSQAIPILLGADLGTTLTVQLIAFPIHAISPLIMSVGLCIYCNAKRERGKSMGAAVLGFGFIFYGLHLITETIRLIPFSSDLSSQLSVLSRWPFILLLLAAGLTALFHSSAATLAIALALGNAGFLTMQGAIPILLGANIGTCAPAFFASLKGSVDSRRLATAHILSKLFATILLYPFIEIFAHYVMGTAQTLPRQIANAHTFFNLGLLFLFLPLSAPFARIVTRLVKIPSPLEDPALPKYLDPKLLSSPPFALDAASRESLRMAAIVQAMLYDVKSVFTRHDNMAEIAKIRRQEEAVDRLNREIKHYIIGLSAKGLSERESSREMTLLNFISHLENIGDVIDNNLLELGEKKTDQGVRFSDAGLQEIHLFHHAVCRDFDEVLVAFESGEKEKATCLIHQREQFYQQGQAMRAAHIERLHQGVAYTVESSAIHLDFITHLSRIRSHITAIAHTIVEG